MKNDRPSMSHLLEWQLHSVPMVNAAAEIQELESGKKILTVPVAHKAWSRAARHVLPIRDRKRVELDALSAETIALLDGKHTVEEIIDLHQRRWQLSFFEARGMILDFLRPMVKRGIVILNAPENPRTEERTTDPD